jgi:murein DD-endopeptidase MepM/ murein hydrolase activator NlpD
MRFALELMCSWPLRRAVALTLLAIGLQACSGETTRFSDNLYGPRNAPAQGDVTGSVSSAPVAPANHVEAHPLPRTSQTRASTPVAYSAATPTPAPNLEVTGTVPASGVHNPNSHGQWSWDGGTAVTVMPGETIEGIARRHGVPASAILEANNLASPHAIQAGQRLVIPRYVPAATVASLPQPPRAAPAPPEAKPAPTAPDVHVVAAGDTLSKIARQYRKTVAELAKANNIQPGAKLNIGDRIIIAGTRVSKAKGEPDEAAPVPSKPAGKEVAAIVTPSPEAPNPGATVTADATPGFRWPVHGRVIAAFGAKANGQQNDGIDVAVPENTPIKAAEDGVVAYAGNELKGYGNLVLVRHPNGYVTAYAHAKELLVKKGDPVKRGQVIAKSGQSGNVEAPELHFEVRKGTAPIDPMQFLKGA